jgi:pathogenesis-related protein 1
MDLVRWTGPATLALAALVFGEARAASMDCLHFDAFEGGLAPAGPMRDVQRLHNCARRTAQPRPVPRLRDLTWSATVASSAQSWANQCIWKHPGGHGYGENLAAGTAGWYDPPSLTGTWIDEYVHYDYVENTCAPGEVCGHYTQVVWRGTQQLGCATNICTTSPPWGGAGNWLYLVCRYSPPGNVIGQRPY